MLGRFAGQLDAWVLAEGVERTAELESLIRLRVPLAQGYLLGRPAEPWATLPGEPAATIRERQTPQTFQDSVVGLTVDGATTWACSASSSWWTGSWPAPAPRRRCGSSPAPLGRAGGGMSRWESGAAQVDSPTVGRTTSLGGKGANRT